MAEATPTVNCTFCEIREIRYTLPAFLCDRCQQRAPYVTTASPTAIDVNLDHYAELPVPLQRRSKKQTLVCQVHVLAQKGLSYSAIAREVGLHRVTVKRWLERQPPPLEVVEPALVGEKAEQIPPPVPWSSWDEVKQVREALQEHRFLLLRRPEHLNEEQQHQVAFLLASPVGSELGEARHFHEDWWCRSG